MPAENSGQEKSGILIYLPMTNNILLFLRYTLGNFLIIPLSLLSKKLRHRVAFERDYGVKVGDVVSGDLWFHVSSEGEWEQIWPIATYFLENTTFSMTIWFTSDSLRNKVDKIRSNSSYQSRLGIYCLNLLCFNPWSRRSILSHRAPKLFFMVRYDFFPELMAQGARASSFILLSATLKNKTNRGQISLVKSLFLRNRYAHFNEIVAAACRDAQAFQALFESGNKSVKIDNYDFRHHQIRERQQHQSNLKSSHFKDSFEQLLAPFAFDQRVILGNLWAHELPIFTDDFLAAIKRKDYLVFIAPHHLKGGEFEQIKSWFNALEDFDSVFWDDVGIHRKGNLILCQVPGLLCEVYSFFGHCYIANGFGRSIHSILEPFWGGGNLYCGPKVFRSTEYDFAREYYKREEGLEMPFVIKDLHDFFSILEHNKSVVSRKEKLDKYGNSISIKMNELLQQFQSMLDNQNYRL